MLVYGEEYFAQYNVEKWPNVTFQKVVDILEKCHMTNFSYELCELEKWNALVVQPEQFK